MVTKGASFCQGLDVLSANCFTPWDQNLVCISFSSSVRLSFFIQSVVKFENRSLET